MTITHTETVGYHAYSLLHSPNGPVVTASPGDGWLIEVTRRETGESWTERVVTWLVHQNGAVVPAVVDELESGGTWFPTQDAEFSVRIFHPSHPEQQTPEQGTEVEGDSPDV
jgi:hypothetical protein